MIHIHGEWVLVLLSRMLLFQLLSQYRELVQGQGFGSESGLFDLLDRSSGGNRDLRPMGTFTGSSGECTVVLAEEEEMTRYVNIRECTLNK